MLAVRLMISSVLADITDMLVSALLVLASASVLGALLALIAPVLRASYYRSQRDLEERLFLIKLRIVRKSYPQLHELTYSEILEQYDVEALYDDIGRSPYATF